MDLNKAFEEACGRYDGSNFDQLSESDKILVTIWALEAEVNNGGFSQLYYNTAGGVAYYAPEALRKIGAFSMAEITERANQRFGPDGPPIDPDDRQNRLDELEGEDEDLWDADDDEFYDYPDDIAELLIIYLQKQPG